MSHTDLLRREAEQLKAMDAARVRRDSWTPGTPVRPSSPGGRRCGECASLASGGCAACAVAVPSNGVGL